MPLRACGPEEHGAAADVLRNDYLLPRQTCPSDAIYPSHDYLRDLVKIFISSVETVPVLRRHFGTSSVPVSWEDWEKLPVTNLDIYAQLSDFREAFREPCRVFSPVAPLDLSSPSFPLTVLQSYEDKLCLDERLEHILRLSGCQDHEKITFVIGNKQRYASSDLAELLIYLNHQCSIILAECLDQTDLAHKLGLLGSRVLIWLSAEHPSTVVLPASVSTVITFNQTVEVPYQIRHVDVLHIDIVPYFATSNSGNYYSVVPNQFYLETTSEKELLITTFRQDLLPLIRYATGWCVDLKANGFDLLARYR